MTTDGQPTDGERRENREHLSGDQLNRYVDGDLSTDERRAADLHLSACDRCAAELADLTAISSLLGSLPPARVPRSFQLDSSHARTTSSFWQRFGAALLPVLPAMRAGTIALALAFASVTAYRVVDDGAPQPEDSAMIAQPTTSLIESTATVPTAGRAAETAVVATEVIAAEAEVGDEADNSVASDAFAEEEESAGSTADLAPPAGEDDSLDEAPAGDEPSDETMDMFEAQEAADADGASAEPESANLEMAQSAPVEASPTAEPTSTMTATASPTATRTMTALAIAPTPLPTEMPAPVAEEGSDDPAWLGRAQLVLGVMLALLGGLVVGVQRLRRKVTG